MSHHYIPGPHVSIVQHWFATQLNHSPSTWSSYHVWRAKYGLWVWYLNAGWHWECKVEIGGILLQNYASQPQLSSLPPFGSFSAFSSQSKSPHGSPEKVNFTSYYQMKDRVVVNELKEFFKLPGEDFKSCKPFHWWLGWKSQFPNLYCLACNVFSIPGNLHLTSSNDFIHIHLLGSAVAVEWIFSGGRNTILLHHASLVPEMIWVLMLVKQHLCLACIAAQNKDWLITLLHIILLYVFLHLYANPTVSLAHHCGRVGGALGGSCSGCQNSRKLDTGGL